MNTDKSVFKFVNTPPAKAGGFRLRLKAGSIGHSADYLHKTGAKAAQASVEAR